jgi:hypothetical protein
VGTVDTVNTASRTMDTVHGTVDVGDAPPDELSDPERFTVSTVPTVMIGFRSAWSSMERRTGGPGTVPDPPVRHCDQPWAIRTPSGR